MNRRVVLLGGAGLLAVAAVALVVADASAAVAVGVLVPVATALVMVLLVRQHRSVKAGLAANRRRLRHTLGALGRLEARTADLPAAESVDELAQRVEQVERQTRAEAAELSRQLAVLSRRVLDGQQRLVDGQRDIARGQRRMAQRVEHLQATPAPAPSTPSGSTAAPDRPTAPAVRRPDSLADLALDADEPGVVLVLDSFTPSQLFAGVRTTLLLAAGLAASLGRPLRVVVWRDPAEDPAAARDLLRDWLATEAGHPDLAAAVALSLPSDDAPPVVHADDVWIATFWSTARAVGLGVDAGRIHRDRVVYLVQDWEPGFYAWGDNHLAARRTYEQGFRLVINSASLARYVRDQTGLALADALVLRPQVDDEQLRLAAARWTPTDEPGAPRLLFYARPSKPRNLHELGVATLRTWVDSLPDNVQPVVRVAGEDAARLDLGGRARVEHLGKVSLEQYYRLVARTDLALALMHSPHPSHLPLELAMAGVPTVTNAFGDYRSPWLHGLTVAPAAPASLAAALTAQLPRATSLRVHAFEPLPTDLGAGLDACVRRLTDDLARTP